MYDTILFDLDGTLTDPKEGITRCIQYALQSFGIDEPDLDTLVRFIGPPQHRTFAEGYGFDNDKANAAVAKYRERFGTVGLFENSAYPGVIDLLADLKRTGKTLAIATSKPGIYTHRILERFGLAPFFDRVVGSELDGTRTDKAEVITEALKQLGLGEGDKSRVVMVGDRKHDIAGAKACGIRSVGVRYGYAEPGELETAGADFVVGSVVELKGLLS